MLKVKKTLSCLLGLQLALAFAVSPAMVRTAYADDPDGEPVMTVQDDGDGDTQDPQPNRPDIQDIVVTVIKASSFEQANDGSFTIEGYSTFSMDYPMEFSIDGGNTWIGVPDTGIVTGLGPTLVQIRFKDEPSECREFDTAKELIENAADTISFVTTNASSSVDGSVTITNSAEAPMEYSVDSGEMWTDVPSNGVISGLDAGIVLIRFKLVETDDVVYQQSDAVEARIKAVKDTEYDITAVTYTVTKISPNAGVTKGSITIKSYDSSKPMEYSIDSGKTWKSVPSDGKITGLSASTVQIRYKSFETEDTVYKASAAKSVTVEKKAAPSAPSKPTVSSSMTYKAGAAYTISIKVTSSTKKLEYMVTSSSTAPSAAQWNSAIKNKKNYAKGKDDGTSVTISGLTLKKTNTYYVHARYCATDTKDASKSMWTKAADPLTTYPAYKAVATKYTYKVGTTTHTLLNAKTYRATSVSTLNTALTAAKKATAKDPYVIHVLKGTYKLSKGIVIPANTYLVNESGASYIWTGASGANQMISVSGYLYGGTYNGSSKVISVIYFTKKTTFSGNNGIVNKATVTKAKKNGITAYEGAKNVQILNCKATYCIENGISIERGSTAKLIQGCTSSNNTYSGINLSHSSVTTIKSCVLKNNGDKGLSTNSDPFSSWGAVGKNTYGCTITTMTGCTVQGNKAHGVHLKPYCKIGTFSSNKLINNEDGLVCNGVGSDKSNKGPSTATVKSCTFSGNTRSNLHAKNPKAVITVGASNTFDGASKSKNCLMATEGGALKITGSNNVIKNAVNAGISVTGSSSSVTISGTGTKIQTNGKQGIFIDAGKVTITGGNTLVSSNKDAGLWARNKGTLTMSGSGNKVTKNATYGAFARDGATMTLKGVNLSGNTKGATSTSGGGKITK